ncbi:MAG: tannase/feruloyl esterase family alpha/beta hydrolase [Capsulimonadaceae bacterium]|nr:tannase/feruloyl esterase family alpha/beta hydrolase [Capsulimonadaceae bacterium]
MNDTIAFRSLLGALVCLAIINQPSQASSPGTSLVIAKDAAVMQTNLTPSLEDRLATLKSLKIDFAAITLVEHDTTQTLTTPDGQTHNNLPPRTIVKMVLSPAKGSTINVEIWMPDEAKWNGRLLGLGNGGAAGHINSLGLSWPVSGGYVAATTDMGTAPNSDSGIGNKEVWKDFGYRATHLMTVAAKQVVRAYYGKDAVYSYFLGGSTGGQQALQEAQRYPDDYDGIVANIPAHCRTPLHAYFLWNYQILAKCPFTKTQEQAVVDAGNEYMASREAPPIAGKFVSDSRCNSKDMDAVIALALQKDPTLTQEHAIALRKIFEGPTHAITHERIFDGLPIGASFDGAFGNLYLFQWVFGANKALRDIDFGKDFDTYTAALGPYLNAENPDLSAFEKRGGKLIMLAGSADPCVPYHVSIDYYERVIERFGSLAKVQSFFDFYIIPGMAHGGGPGINHPPDMLSAVREWREKGNAPGELQGKRIVDGETVLTMPLFPYPSKTGWDAATSTFKRIDGARGGVDRVSDHFLPPAAE